MSGTAAATPTAAVATAPDDPRIEVWLALSELYLDNESSDSYDSVARALAASPFERDTLYDMLMYEVHPALYPNLMSMTGEWAGFGRDWLVERISHVRARPRWRRRMTHLFVRWIREDWNKIAARIDAIRNAPPAGTASECASP
ncbi:MAG: hypothetical protein IT473_12280 [Lysobacter sp.]|nr:hypothetical protein [Lysobacter sp.]